ncbi:hypothetical protein [Motiliproteus sediminis]|uniref:hypothetical protein n=1 Tax=Motiliproteus sediminis TaxID=1468178 RepID=UPI001AF0154B|nr:hypothetical protein [Motiliproteus sediminis]
MSTKSVSRWFGNKAKGLRDTIEKLRQDIARWGAGDELEPIPIRIDDTAGNRRRR